MPYIILIICLAAFSAIQLMVGNLPVRFFAFPLNLILALIWAFGIVTLWRSKRKSAFVRFMLSKEATLCAVSLFLVFCLIIGITGVRTLTQSWPFAFVLLYFQSVLLFVILRGWRTPSATGSGGIRWRFILNHCGILLAVSAAFWGAPDSETLRIRAIRDVPVNEAYRMDGSMTLLDYRIELKDFRMDVYENGTPLMYEASLLIDGVPADLRVNKPYSRSVGEDVYLTGYNADDSSACILQVVREPWKYAALAGIVMMLTGALLLFVAGPRKRYVEEE